LDKFRDKNGNCRGNIKRVEKDNCIPKFAVRYTLQADETRGKVKIEREQEWVEGPRA
jgi:hypothetical protein